MNNNKIFIDGLIDMLKESGVVIPSELDNRIKEEISQETDLENLEETSQSMVKRTKKAKRSAYAGSTAVRLAKAKNDPMYKKLARYKKLYMESKKKIRMKYKSKANKIARAKMR